MPTTSAESVPWERFVYPRKSAKKTVAGIISCFFLLTLVNMVSQMLHRFGFIRLILMPSSLNGIDNGPRMGIGICICCQHPLQIIDSETAMFCSCPFSGFAASDPSAELFIQSQHLGSTSVFCS